MAASRLFLSTCEENNLTVWSLDSGRDGRKEKRLTTLYQVKLFRPVKHLQYLSRDISHGANGDRFMFSYESGEFDIFEIENYGSEITEKRVHLVDTDKSREHEQPLTAMDFHRNLNLILTACQGGMLKIWSTNNLKGLGDK